MNRTLIVVAALASLAAVAGCTEKPQTLSSGVKSDTHAWQGTGKQFALPSWKQGDKGSWEQQLKTRTQNGQNDYTRVN